MIGFSFVHNCFLCVQWSKQTFLLAFVFVACNTALVFFQPRPRIRAIVFLWQSSRLPLMVQFLSKEEVIEAQCGLSKKFKRQHNATHFICFKTILHCIMRPFLLECNSVIL